MVPGFELCNPCFGLLHIFSRNQLLPSAISANPAFLAFPPVLDWIG